MIKQRLFIPSPKSQPWKIHCTVCALLFGKNFFHLRPPPPPTPKSSIPKKKSHYFSVLILFLLSFSFVTLYPARGLRCRKKRESLSRVWPALTQVHRPAVDLFALICTANFFFFFFSLSLPPGSSGMKKSLGRT